MQRELPDVVHVDAPFVEVSVVISDPADLRIRAPHGVGEVGAGGERCVAGFPRLLVGVDFRLHGLEIREVKRGTGVDVGEGLGLSEG
jgi:hypothetical protein